MEIVDPSERREPHDVLRGATRECHDRLDAAFGSLDLSDRNGFTRFLSAHYMALVPLEPIYRGFVADRLNMLAPDYPALLRDDLAELGCDAAALPFISAAQPASPPLDPAAISYVIAGSRLGLAMIRKRPNWGSTHGHARRYMEETGGIDVWRGLLAWMKTQNWNTQQADRAGQSAVAAFATFDTAFHHRAASSSLSGIPA